MREKMTSEFWYYYDIASIMATQDPQWDLLNMRRMYAADQAGVSFELEEMIVNSLDEQYLMIISELFEIIIVAKNISCQE